jgi:hypothetical protein
MGKAAQVVVPGIVLLGVVIFLALGEATWATLFVAAAAVLVAFFNGQTQQGLAEQQTELTLMLQGLTLAPVITGCWKLGALVSGSIIPHGLQVRNVGKGPAYDLRGTVFGAPDPDTGKPRFEATPAELEESHLAPGETAYFELTAKQMDPRRSDYPRDVWIVHCADMMGKPHYHAWCNWTRAEQGDHYREGEPFIFETVERSPDTIRQMCLQCRERRAAHVSPSASDSSA